MRVIAGTHGGRRLRVPRGRATRPTSDRVREALFSTVGAAVRDAAVLDLFAGSGALGIEAMSRGAATATFVERDRATARVLRDNLDALALDAVVHTTDVGRFVRDPDGHGVARPFDLVLCDPPYDHSDDALDVVLVRLADAGALAPAALVVVERPRHARAPTAARLPTTDRRRYGDTTLHYLRYRPSDPHEGDDTA